MSEVKGYDVIQMVEKEGRCYQVLDYTQGWLLVDMLREQPQIAKADLFCWIKKIIRDVEQLERCGRNISYKYLTPYGIMIEEHGLPLLLDLWAEDNAPVRQKMEEERVKKKFCPQNACGQEKQYSLGKTIQYLLAKTIISPKLSKKEETALSRLILHCIETEGHKRSYTLKQIVNEGMQFLR